MAVTASIHTLQDYLDQAAPVLLEIPGLSQLMRADGNSYDVLAGMYPDAAFTLVVMNNLFHHDCEFSEIHQQAFSAIIEEMDIPSVRKRYDLCMDAYWQKHSWDD
jgi:hypothetical protein